MIRKLSLFLFALMLAPLLAFGQVVTNPGMTGLPAVGATTAFSVTATVTRPANTTTYTANDVIGGSPTAVISLASLAPSGSSVLITSASLEIDVTSIPSGMTSFRLYLYSVTPPSALADDAAWDLPSGDRASYLGYIDLGSPADLGSTLFVQADQINRQIKLAGTGVFAYLVTNGGYIATSGAVKIITLSGVVL